ncbi:predicted protein [Chaetoceros tenuissimus]|uniref:Circumsporozoite protein n=1 Tax=Chaetoceros tenuissimus TaxID=426638 RepID=A0AAD3CMQ5_9STRA|nr:predicted protein [Chaetoceros tenuissimus]
MCLLYLLLLNGSYGSSDRYLGSKEQRNESVADTSTHPICTHITSLLGQPIRRNEIHQMCQEEMDGRVIHEICQEACDEFVVDSRFLQFAKEDLPEFEFTIFNHEKETLLEIKQDHHVKSQPTKSFTEATTKSLTSEEAIATDERDCTDDTSFKFLLDNGQDDKMVNCAWLTENTSKADIRMKRYCKRGHVAGACLSSCGNCDCADDPLYIFPLAFSGMPVDCSWLEDKPSAMASRRSKYCLKDDARSATNGVGSKCIRSCGFCSGGTASPTTSASPSVSLAPTMPTTAPTFSCQDDDSFKFTIKSGKRKTCEWLSVKQKRRDKWCHKGDIAGACIKTCSNCECHDQSDYSFKAKNGFSRKCSWLQNKGRRNRYCYQGDAELGIASDIGSACMHSCKFCSRVTHAPSQMPTPVISEIPSNLPSISMSPTASSFPSISPSSHPSATSSMKATASITAEGVCKSSESLETAMINAIIETTPYTNTGGFEFSASIVDTISNCAAINVRSRNLQTSSIEYIIDFEIQTSIASNLPTEAQVIASLESNEGNIENEVEVNAGVVLTIADVELIEQPTSAPSSSSFPSSLPSIGPTATALPSNLPSMLPSMEPSSCVDNPSWAITLSNGVIVDCTNIGETGNWCTSSTYGGQIVNGLTASQACCVCGGSILFSNAPSVMSESPSISTSPSTLPSLSLSPSGQPSQSPSECADNPIWSIEIEVDDVMTTINCGNIGSNAAFCEASNVGRVVVNGFTAEDACCVCGATHFVSDYPSSIPSSLPSTSPSDFPSSIPSFEPSQLPSSSPSMIPSMIPSQSPSECVDKPSWTVNDNTGDFVCSDFTETWQCNWITANDDDGDSANDACCFCGGGSHK